MLGLFKLQGKKKSLCTNPVSYKTSWAGHEGGGMGKKRRGHPWAGGWVPGRARGNKRGLPDGRGLIVLMGGVQKARQKRGFGGLIGQCFLHQGTVLEGAWCPPAQPREPVTHKPLAQAPFETDVSLSLPLSWSPFPGAHLAGLPFWDLGPSHSSLSNVLWPLHLRAGQPGGEQGGQWV
jgi:hypothetical protein